MCEGGELSLSLSLSLYTDDEFGAFFSMEITMSGSTSREKELAV